ncbi:MAG: hypothetical protein DKM50_09040 [Candidatus Margulisiibacteriota bacterium]|nr:MAG: hypothetical protein A2X43_01930 [Candidatus Margulisbacteria bacterium GWD2_39_127]OGI01334.1 MAG: hypothetical protein A2X42_06575 [Candidatus Margulisbacteria bacterium GWF2_38_17]OGI10798.1 MAG: hypothetical protein A2X41_00830 [Candidatus Margulisbacteria bacterium GWE2_39_32]PZM79402.1 MAG: hypothetical protein DKM50_09040 [Candidatus Margulisiibacteriota bacterium]HAR63548.1 hypothetical protein [Candidatus Margulisiibacteriota bacterium]
MTKSKSFRLPEGIANKLHEIAESTHRPEKYYVVEALKFYFEEYSDAQIAKDRFEDPQSKIISSEVLRKRLGVYGCLFGRN